MRALCGIFLFVCVGLAGCQRRGCASMATEVAVPRGPNTRAIASIHLVAPTSMSGTNVLKVARIEGADDIYEFSTLAFFHEERRDLVVALTDGVTAVFPLPAGEQAPAAMFTAWAPPLYGSTDRIVNLQVLHGDVPSKISDTPSIRARYRFDARHCE